MSDINSCISQNKYIEFSRRSIGLTSEWVCLQAHSDRTSCNSIDTAAVSPRLRPVDNERLASLIPACLHAWQWDVSYTSIVLWVEMIRIDLHRAEGCADEYHLKFNMSVYLEIRYNSRFVKM